MHERDRERERAPINNCCYMQFTITILIVISKEIDTIVCLFVSKLQNPLLSTHIKYIVNIEYYTETQLNCSQQIPNKQTSYLLFC